MAHCFGEMELEWLVGPGGGGGPALRLACLYVHLSLSPSPAGFPASKLLPVLMLMRCINA